MEYFWSFCMDNILNCSIFISDRYNGMLSNIVPISHPQQQPQSQMQQQSQGVIKHASNSASYSMPISRPPPPYRPPRPGNTAIQLPERSNGDSNNRPSGAATRIPQGIPSSQQQHFVQPQSLYGQPLRTYGGPNSMQHQHRQIPLSNSPTMNMFAQQESQSRFNAQPNVNKNQQQNRVLYSCRICNSFR